MYNRRKNSEIQFCAKLRNLVESKPFKTPSDFIFFQITIDFLKKRSNFNSMSLGSRMQISYTHKLGMHKGDFSQTREVCASSSQFSEILNSNAPHDRFSVYQIKITFKQ